MRGFCKNVTGSKIPALCPISGGSKVVYLTMDLVEKVLRYGPRSRYFAIVGDRSDPTTGSPVQETLLHPTVVFKGVREHQDGGVCYTGKPSCRYTESGAKVPPISGNGVFGIH
jgi:hypothetical protein